VAAGVNPGNAVLDTRDWATENVKNSIKSQGSNK
jgi:hypothetical protein